MNPKFFVAICVFVVLTTSVPHTANALQTSSSLQTGYIRLIPDAGNTAPAGMTIFGLKSGVILINEAGVPSMPTVLSGRIFVDVAGSVNTGIAFANPNDQDVVISYYFTDGSGGNFNAGSLPLTANHQVATFLTEQPFGLKPSSAATFTFSSTLPIATIALRSFVNERSEVLITTVAVSPIGDGFGGTALLIPLLPDGAGWSTQLVLVNPGDQSISGTLQFLSALKNGGTQPAKVVIGRTTSSTFNYTIPPRSAVRMSTQPARNTTQIRSVRIKPAAQNVMPSGFAVFSYQNGGITVSAASVPAMPAAKAFRMYIESSGTFGQVGSIQTGITISNPSTSRMIVDLSVWTLNGTFVRNTSIDIPAGGQIAKFANALFPQLPSSFRGVLRIASPSGVGAVGLRARYNERGDLLMTTTQPHDEASASPLELDFPHFVSGDGYFTQLILVSTGSVHKGKLLLMSKDGVALPGTLLQPIP